jgi:hypothetical protein
VGYQIMSYLIAEIVEYLLDRHEERKSDNEGCKDELVDVIRLHLLHSLQTSMKQEAAQLIVDIIVCLGCNPVMVPEPYSLYGCLEWECNEHNKTEVEYIMTHMKRICGSCTLNEYDIARAKKT